MSWEVWSVQQKERVAGPFETQDEAEAEATRLCDIYNPIDGERFDVHEAGEGTE